ncbi:MAG: cytochrome P450 [Pseudomonadales bacterium]
MKTAVLKVLSSTMQLSLWLLRRVDYYFTSSVVSLHDDGAADPCAAFNTLRERGRILRSLTYGGWIVSGHQEVTSLLRDPRVSNDLRNNGFVVKVVRFAAGGVPLLNVDHPTMLGVDAPDHTRLRKLVAQGFLHRYVQSLAPAIEGLVDELLDAVPANAGRVEIMQAVARPLPAIVIAEMMGVPRGERHLFERWSEALLGASDILNPALIRKSGEANVEMRAYLARLVEKKRLNPSQDLISQLIAAEEGGDRLTLDELYSNCILLLAAGHETTTRLIGNCLYLLCRHPQQMAAARRSEALLMNALEEALRFEPPVLFTVRTVREPFSVNGCNFKPGQMLMLSIAGANRDPAANVDPDRFDIEREKVTHVSFGYGVHLCLGMSLARLEAKIVFRRLFERFTSIELADGDDAIWGTSPMFRGLESLTVDVSEGQASADPFVAVEASVVAVSAG